MIFKPLIQPIFQPIFQPMFTRIVFAVFPEAGGIGETVLLFDGGAIFFNGSDILFSNEAV